MKKQSRQGRKKEVSNLLQPILLKYERLNLVTPIYKDLKRSLQDKEWRRSINIIIDRVKNSESIFSISKEITRQKK